MFDSIRATLVDSVHKGMRFLFLLPGFLDIGETDQKILIAEKLFGLWMVRSITQFVDKITNKVLPGLRLKTVNTITILSHLGRRTRLLLVNDNPQGTSVGAETSSK